MIHNVSIFSKFCLNMLNIRKYAKNIQKYAKEYSKVPNERTGVNKRTGGKLCQN